MRGLLAAIVCVTVASLYAWIDPNAGISTWLELRGELRAAEARIASLRLDIETLQAEISALDAGPFALERAIREELDWVRPGEILVRMRRASQLGTQVP